VHSDTDAADSYANSDGYGDSDSHGYIHAYPNSYVYSDTNSNDYGDTKRYTAQSETTASPDAAASPDRTRLAATMSYKKRILFAVCPSELCLGVCHFAAFLPGLPSKRHEIDDKLQPNSR
jgi:hypothetical protein